MPDKTISQLPEADIFAGGEAAPIVQSGETRGAIAGVHFPYLVGGKIPAEFFPPGGLDLVTLIDTIIGHSQFGKLVRAIVIDMMARGQAGGENAVGAALYGYVAEPPSDDDPYPLPILWDKAERIFATAAEIRAGQATVLAASVKSREEAADPGAEVVLNGGTTTFDLNDGHNRQISLTANSTLNLFANLRVHDGGYISGRTAGAFSLTIGQASGVTVVPLTAIMAPPQTANDRFAYAWFAPTSSLVLIGKIGEALL